MPVDHPVPFNTIECAVASYCSEYIPLADAVAADYLAWETKLGSQRHQWNEHGVELGECALVSALAYRHARLMGIDGAVIQMGRTGGNVGFFGRYSGHAWLALPGGTRPTYRNADQFKQDPCPILDSPSPRVVVVAPPHWHDREFFVRRQDGAWGQVDSSGRDAYDWRSGRMRFQPFKRSRSDFDARWAGFLRRITELWLESPPPPPKSWLGYLSIYFPPSADDPADLPMAA